MTSLSSSFANYSSSTGSSIGTSSWVNGSTGTMTPPSSTGTGMAPVTVLTNAQLTEMLQDLQVQLLAAQIQLNATTTNLNVTSDMVTSQGSDLQNTMGTVSDLRATQTDAGDTAWLLTSTALVLMMTPALGFFYGGLVNDKNILNQLFMSYICMGIVAVQWALYGYSFAFDRGTSTWGTFNWSVLRFGLVRDDFLSATYPLLLHTMYQGAFAIITPALISGSIVGRIRFIPYVIFILLWSTLCYDPLAHWVWSKDGWLRNLGVDASNSIGAIDFAGGTVVHISSGVSGLVAAWVVGKRVDYDPKNHASPAPNLPYTLLGSALLWIGWNGFNAGSASAANQFAALAMVNTNIAAAAAMLTWCFMEVAVAGNPTIAGASTGAVVGLVVITPACGYIQPGWAIFMGIVGTMICFGVGRFKAYMKVDDTLDVFTCHGVGGISGALMTGLFAQKEWNGGLVNGSFYGHGIQFWYQLAAVLTTVGYAAGITWGILIVLKYTIGLRPDEEAEKLGLDEHVHGESYRKDPSLTSRRESPNNSPTAKTTKSAGSTANNSTSDSTEMVAINIEKPVSTYPVQTDAQAEALTGHSHIHTHIHTHPHPHPQSTAEAGAGVTASAPSDAERLHFRFPSSTAE